MFKFIKNYYLAFCVLFAGIILTIMLCVLIFSFERAHIKEGFLQQAQIATLRIEDQIKDDLMYVKSTAFFFNASDTVTRQEFKVFTQHFLDETPCIRAVEWIPRVKDNQREEYVQQAREFFPEFQTTIRARQGKMEKSPKKTEYYPVYYVNPYYRNEMALGFDVASDPTRLTALNKARDTGRMVATGRIVLAQAAERKNNVLVFFPVYQKGAATDLVSNRRENLKGFALGVYQIESILEHALMSTHQKVNIEILDLSANRQNRFLGFYKHRNHKLQILTEQEAAKVINKRGIYYERKTHVAGRTWLIRCTPPANFPLFHLHGCVTLSITFVFGLLVSLLLFLYFYRTKKYALELIEYQAHLEDVVASRTKELKESNIQLQETHEKLKNSVTSLIKAEKTSVLGTFVAGTAHELSNPLTGALNFVQYCIKHTEQDDKKYNVLKDTKREIDRCIKIIKNLLSFVSKGAEETEDTVAEYLAVILERVMLLFAYRIKKESIKVITNFPENLSKVPIQANKIQQVLLNLMTNAMDALKDSETKKIIVSEEQRDDKVILSVEDTGCGIDPKHLDKIFSSFFTTKPQGVGTGLGLSIVKRIVEDHHGKVSCESQLGKGTKFIIELPLTTEGHHANE